ncbi:MAG: hypothetical protein Tsb0013_13530 [Phycisphaerales bacterium]
MEYERAGKGLLIGDVTRTFQSMIRSLAILILVVASLPRLGVGFTSTHYGCETAECHEAAVEVTCCCCDSGERGYCPMSEGPCECAAAPSPDPEPKPQAPLPRSDRETVFGMPNGPPRVMPDVDPDADAPSVAPQVLVLTAGKSHNEMHALLGTWRT